MSGDHELVRADRLLEGGTYARAELDRWRLVGGKVPGVDCDDVTALQNGASLSRVENIRQMGRQLA